jgi:hypothetical protein
MRILNAAAAAVIAVCLPPSGGGVVALAAAAGPSLQAQAPTVPANRRIEGHWVRVDADGSGSFGGLASRFTPAVLTPEAAKTLAGPGREGGPARGAGPGPAPARPAQTGVPVIVVERPCGYNPGRGNGAILLNPDSGGIHIIEGKDEVVMSGDRGGARHVFLDGRPHPPLAGRVARPAGHSVGRYEGTALLVETVGMTPGPVVAGGLRTAETRLTERFEVSPDGQRLTITYTWNDPKIYQKPHTYSYVFDRLPPGSYAFENWCDASDPLERQSIVPPAQR